MVPVHISGNIKKLCILTIWNFTMHLQGTLCRYKNIYFSYNQRIFSPKIYRYVRKFGAIYILYTCILTQETFDDKMLCNYLSFFCKFYYVTSPKKKKKIKEHNNCRNYIDLKKYIIEFAYTGKKFVPVVLVVRNLREI